MSGVPSWADLSELFALTLRDPGAGAAEVLQRRPARDALWLAFALVVVLVVILDVIVTLASPAADDGGFAISPLAWLVIQAGALWLMTVLAYGIGRALGGQGSFDGALALTCWLELVCLVFVAGLVVVSLVLPPMAFVGILALTALRLWLMTNFVATLHGFQSLGVVFLGILGVIVTLGLVVFMVMSTLGIELPMGDLQ